MKVIGMTDCDLGFFKQRNVSVLHVQAASVNRAILKTP